MSEPPRDQSAIADLKGCKLENAIQDKNEVLESDMECLKSAIQELKHAVTDRSAPNNLELRLAS